MMPRLHQEIVQQTIYCSYESSYEANYQPSYDVQFVFYDEDEYEDDEAWNEFNVPLPISGSLLYPHRIKNR
jgi:hypothetical protein